jgi:hypothetical protein
MATEAKNENATAEQLAEADKYKEQANEYFKSKYLPKISLTSVDCHIFILCYGDFLASLALFSNVLSNFRVNAAICIGADCYQSRELCLKAKFSCFKFLPDLCLSLERERKVFDCAT